jgi:hypothetical protein
MVSAIENRVGISLAGIIFLASLGLVAFSTLGKVDLGALGLIAWGVVIVGAIYFVLLVVSDLF